MTQRWAPPTRYTLQHNPVSIMRDNERRSNLKIKTSLFYIQYHISQQYNQIFEILEL